MATRQGFEQELEGLKSLVLEMGNKAEKSLRNSIAALINQDVDLALKVIDKDFKINKLNDEINEKVIWLIAKQQPVATDLRRIIASLKISTDLERIGDLAVNIAKSTIRIGNETLFKPLQDIPLMAEKAQKMLSKVLEAYNTENVILSNEVAESDNEVDEMYGRLIQELLLKISESSTLIAQITQLILICRNLERVADHTTNIAESVIFTVRGKIYDLNQ